MSDRNLSNHECVAKQGVLLMCRSGNTLAALASILNRAGSNALTAQNGADAWECMRSGSVGCVVQDLTNITPDAFTFFRACRSSRNTFSIPFLFLTTADFTPPKFEGVWPETARDGWLVLPCPSQQFLSGVRNLLQANLPIAPLPAQANGGKSSGSGVFAKAAASTMRLKAVEMPSPQTSLFSGKLGTLQFSQILGLIEPLRLTGVLKLFDGVRTGGVHFVDGKVHHAELNEIEGSEALFLLFHLNNGSFQFEEGKATAKRTVEGNTMSLLLEGMRKMDEAKAMVSAIKERQSTGAYASVTVRMDS